jgi:hypothetical protein
VGVEQERAAVVFDVTGDHERAHELAPLVPAILFAPANVRREGRLSWFPGHAPRVAKTQWPAVRR